MKPYMSAVANGTALRCEECQMVTPVYERGEHHELACSHRRGTFIAPKQPPATASGETEGRQA